MNEQTNEQNNKLIQNQCILCEENQKISKLYPRNFIFSDLTPEVFSARRNTNSCHYEIVKCKCGMVFSNAILPFEEIAKLYQKSSLTYTREIENIADSYFNVFKNIFTKEDKNISILEFGCGNGFFLNKLFNNGFKNILGIEPGEKALEMAEESIKENLKAGFIEDLDNDKKFDFICSFQTLDHLYNPLKTLKKCRELCNPKGKCLVIVHNTESLQAKILRDKSPIIDIEHVYLFNKKTIALAFKKAGFTDIKVIDVKNTYTLKYWVSMFPLPKMFKKLILNIFMFAGLENVKISLKAGNIAAVGTKE